LKFALAVGGNKDLITTFAEKSNQGSPTAYEEKNFL